MHQNSDNRAETEVVEFSPEYEPQTVVDNEFAVEQPPVFESVEEEEETPIVPPSDIKLNDEQALKAESPSLTFDPEFIVTQENEALHNDLHAHTLYQVQPEPPEEKKVSEHTSPQSPVSFSEKESEQPGFETTQLRLKVTEPATVHACPFCSTPNDMQNFVCNLCMSVLTLSDLELLLANQNADHSLVRPVVDFFESERANRHLGEYELTTLGIGYLNLRDNEKGYAALAEAARVNPDNVVLNSQVNALLIRLEEIRRQSEVHETQVRGKSIMVVDDSPTIRKLISGKLEKSGHVVHTACDGLEAVAMLGELKPDLVLLDITMPKMDGYQVCKAIRSNDVTKEIPVVMISGNDGFFDKVRGRMAGTTGYITKPFGPETLMKAVEKYINNGHTPNLEMDEPQSVPTVQ